MCYDVCAALEALKDRFMRHVQPVARPKGERTVQLSVIRKDSAPSGQEELCADALTVTLTEEEEKPAAKPGNHRMFWITIRRLSKFQVYTKFDILSFIFLYWKKVHRKKLITEKIFCLAFAMSNVCFCLFAFVLVRDLLKRQYLTLCVCVLGERLVLLKSRLQAAMAVRRREEREKRAALYRLDNEDCAEEEEEEEDMTESEEEEVN